jgi:hypothetical protein
MSDSFWYDSPVERVPRFISAEDTNAHTEHQRFMSETFHRNVGVLLGGQREDIQLRQHQPDVFEELDEFMVYTDDPIERRFSLPLPPNAGKSTTPASTKQPEKR